MAEMEEIKKELDITKAKIEEYEAALPAEVMKMVKDGKSMKEAWAEYKKNLKKASELVGQLKAELDPKLTANWSDEDYLNPEKVENARLKMEIAQLKGTQEKITPKETPETASQSTAVELSTGHVDAVETASNENAVAAVIDERRKVFSGKGKK